MVLLDEAATRCDLGFAQDWLRRRAAKQMAVRLATTLSTDYLGSEYYTVPQIQVAYAKLKLNPKFIDIAYAEYLDFESYSTLTHGKRAAYDGARALYRSYLPDGISTGWEAAPVNEYIKQLTGLS
jgi:hypothetical protein